MGWPGVGGAKGLRPKGGPIAGPAPALGCAGVRSLGTRSALGGTIGRCGGWPAKGLSMPCDAPVVKGVRPASPAGRGGEAGGVQAGRGARGPLAAIPAAGTVGIGLTVGTGGRGWKPATGVPVGSAVFASSSSAAGAGGAIGANGGINTDPAVRSGGFSGWALPALELGRPASYAGMGVGAAISGGAGVGKLWGPETGAASPCGCGAGACAPPFWKCVRTFSAMSSSRELECVFFSVTPRTGRRSRIKFALISSSLASSLILTFCIQTRRLSSPLSASPPLPT